MLARLSGLSFAVYGYQTLFGTPQGGEFDRYGIPSPRRSVASTQLLGALGMDFDGHFNRSEHEHRQTNRGGSGTLQNPATEGAREAKLTFVARMVYTVFLESPHSSNSSTMFVAAPPR